MEQAPTLSPSLPEVLIGALALLLVVATVILIASLVRRGRPEAPIDD